MVVIAIAASLIAAVLIGYAVHQREELRRADKRVADLLTLNEDQEITLGLTRVTLDMALAQNVRIKRQTQSDQTNLLLLLNELERVS